LTLVPVISLAIPRRHVPDLAKLIDCECQAAAIKFCIWGRVFNAKQAGCEMGQPEQALDEIRSGPKFWQPSVLPRLLGILGGTLLVAGTAAPLIHIPIVGNISYLHHPTYFHIYNVGELVILAAAGLSIVLVLIKRIKSLWLTGGIALVQLITTLVVFHRTVATVVARADQPELVDPMLMWAGAALDHARLQWGVWVVGIGAIMVIAAAACELRTTSGHAGSRQESRKA
jgi:hypothetical protein